MKKRALSLFALLLSGLSHANTSQELEARYANHRSDVLNNINTSGLPIQAFETKEVDINLLNSMLDKLPGNKNADFDIVKLVRILNFTDKHDDLILPVLADIDYWLTRGEVSKVYWSENHLIMWMGSEWLLHEKYDWPTSDNLRQRLVHFLELKNQYGYYEFFSPTYIGYTFSGLINLADFAEDPEIKDLATRAVKRLLNDALLATTTHGTLYAASGRGPANKYAVSDSGAYGANHVRLLSLLTGFGEVLDSASAASAFLATTSTDLSDVVEAYQTEVNTEFRYGHSIHDSFSINSPLSREDRVMFQWSQGGYFHPSFAADTTWLIDHYDLDYHEYFEFFGGIPGLVPWLSETAAEIGATFSRGSVLSGNTVDIYKNRGVSLTSVDNFYGGYYGYQVMPWAAATESLSVFTVSGEVNEGLLNNNGTSNNTHMPFVRQQDNVALIMYWPNTEINIADTFGFGDISTDVALHWPEEMDETRFNGNWIIGRKGDAYVSVLRECTGTINSIYACSGKNGRQMWAVVVGNKDTHGSFDDFTAMIGQASYRQSYTWDWSKWDIKFYGRVTVDGTTISHNWY